MASSENRIKTHPVKYEAKNEDVLRHRIDMILDQYLFLSGIELVKFNKIILYRVNPNLYICAGFVV